MRRGSQLSVHARLACNPPNRAVPPNDFKTYDELISRDDLAPESTVIDPRQQRHSGTRNGMGFRVTDENPGNLRHGLDNQHARHDAVVRKMPLKKRLIETDVLDSNGIFIRFDFPDAVHQNEWVAMR